MSPSRRSAYHEDHVSRALDTIEGHVLIAKTFQTGWYVDQALLRRLGEIPKPHIVVWLDPTYRGEPALEDIEAAGLDPRNTFVVQTNGRADSIRQWTQEFKDDLMGQEGRPHVTIVLDEINTTLNTGYETKAAIRDLVQAANQDGDTQVIVTMFVRGTGTITPLEEWLDR
jgi:ATP:corrinoid adenosyltransferase